MEGYRRLGGGQVMMIEVSENIQDAFDALPIGVWAAIAGVAVVLIFCVLFVCFYICTSESCCRRAKPDAADLEFAARFQKHASIFEPASTNFNPYEKNTTEIIQSLNARPANGLNSRLSANRSSVGTDASARMVPPVALSNDLSAAEKAEMALNGQSRMKRQKSNDDNASTVSSSNKSNVTNNLTWKPNNPERHKRGLSYGRLDPDAQQRVASIRLNATETNMIPFKVKHQPVPNEKALKMLGVSANEVSKPYSSSVKKRIERIAKGASGGQGLYNAGFGTAALGGQIIDGFQELREKSKRKKDEREKALADMREKEEANKQRWKDNNMPKTVSKGMLKTSLKDKESSSKTQGMKPGSAKLAAFLEETKTPTPGRKGDEDEADDGDHVEI